MNSNEHSPDYLLLISEWESSGENQSSFCKSRGLAFHTFQYYLRKYRKGKEAIKKPGSFVPLHVNQKMDASSRIEVIYPSGERICFHGKVDASYLRALLG